MFVVVADREKKIQGIRTRSKVNILKGARPNGIWNWIIAIKVNVCPLNRNFFPINFSVLQLLFSFHSSYLMTTSIFEVLLHLVSM